jgi:hypothetical protein
MSESFGTQWNIARTGLSAGYAQHALLEVQVLYLAPGELARSHRL